MFCPQCAQERLSEATSFCSRCGYLLTGTAELLRRGGALEEPSANLPSPRSRGVRQGLFMFLLMFVVAPIVGLIATFGLGIEPWPVGVVVVLLGLGGILRMIYALLFESKTPILDSGNSRARELDRPLAGFPTTALPPKSDVTASEYVSPDATRWRAEETREPASVTDNTTKLLEKDTDPHS